MMLWFTINVRWIIHFVPFLFVYHHSIVEHKADSATDRRNFLQMSLMLSLVSSVARKLIEVYIYDPAGSDLTKTVGSRLRSNISSHFHDM